MQKLLHQVFAIWKSDKPFRVPEERAPDKPTKPPLETKKAEGRKGQSPERQAVTPAPSTVPPVSHASNASDAPRALPKNGRRLDFARLRQQISLEQVLRELRWWDCLKGSGPQRRGPCPIHESTGSHGRCFSVNLEKNVFQCFDASCGVKGNALDLWAQSQHLSIPQAAENLAQRLDLAPE
jgi:hypothetical protein